MNITQMNEFLAAPKENEAIAKQKLITATENKRIKYVKEVKKCKPQN